MRKTPRPLRLLAGAAAAATAAVFLAAPNAAAVEQGITNPGFESGSDYSWGELFVDEWYSQTVVGRDARDYVWLMARTPEIPDPDYQRFLTLIAREGYDVSKVRKVPQRWNR